MTGADTVTMDPAARDEFLGDGGTGVVSLSTADDEAPHAVPVSYGYDAAESTFYFRLARGADSEKGPLSGRAVTFVTYGDDGGWWSVVARGRLVETTDEAVGTDALAGLDRVHIPIVDIFGRPSGEVSFGFYRLAPDSLTARQESSTAE